MALRQFAFHNVKRNTRVYLAYFLSSVFTIMTFFSFAVNLFHPVVAGKKGGAIELILGQAEAAILTFSFFFVMISVNAFLKARSKEFGVLRVLGISKTQLRRLVFMENMMIGCLAILCGISLGLVFAKLFLMLLSSILADGSLSFYFPGKAILLTVIFFTLIFLGISALTPLIIRSDSIITLLRGAKRPNREIRFSALWSAAAVLLLGAGYFMALSPQLYGMAPWLDLVVLCIEGLPQVEILLTSTVVIGTYLFFTQFSLLVLQRLKQKKSLYLRKTNLLWISDLAFRVRDNSRMLFLVTILSSVAFTAITGVYALSSVVGDEALKDHPFALTYTSYSGHDREGEHLKTIEAVLASRGLAYEKYESEIIKQVTTNKRAIHIIKESDYNRRAAALSLAPVTLRHDQALLVPVYVRFDPKRDKTLSQREIVLDDGAIELEVIGVAPRVIFYSGLFPNLAVVADETYGKITRVQERYHSYSYVIPDWLHSLEAVQQLRVELGLGEQGRYFWSTRIEAYQVENQNKKLFLYVGFFLGAIFFLGAGSFLYFRLYTDLNQEKNKYKALAKLGLSWPEMKRVAQVQIAVLFFVPFLLATLHTYFAVQVLQTVLYSSVLHQFATVVGAFLLLNIAFYAMVCSGYVNSLKRSIAP